MLPAEQALAEAKSKIFSAIKIEMIRQGYTVSSLADLLNVNRPTLSYAIHGGTTPRDISVRKKVYKVLGMNI